MILPIALLIILSPIFILFIFYLKTKETISDDGMAGIITIVLVGLIAIFFITLITIGSYVGTKANLSVIDERISLTQKLNDERIQSVLPILDKYPALEKEIVKGLNPQAFAVLGDVYPDLKSNQSYTQQAAIVLENIKKIEDLQNNKLDSKKELLIEQSLIFFLN